MRINSSGVGEAERSRGGVPGGFGRGALFAGGGFALLLEGGKGGGSFREAALGGGAKAAKPLTAEGDSHLAYRPVPARRGIHPSTLCMSCDTFP